MKDKYRNRSILKWASRCPKCMMCGGFNDGTVVAAHSNQLRDGKGKGTKAHDCCVAYLCDHCHYVLDQGNTMSRQEKFMEWDNACIKTLTWLFMNDLIDVKEFV